MQIEIHPRINGGSELRAEVGSVGNRGAQQQKSSVI
jgi:hypothetical protein